MSASGANVISTSGASGATNLLFISAAEDRRHKQDLACLNLLQFKSLQCTTDMFNHFCMAGLCTGPARCDLECHGSEGPQS